MDEALQESINHLARILKFKPVDDGDIDEFSAIIETMVAVRVGQENQNVIMLNRRLRCRIGMLQKRIKNLKNKVKDDQNGGAVNA